MNDLIELNCVQKVLESDNMIYVEGRYKKHKDLLFTKNENKNSWEN